MVEQAPAETIEAICEYHRRRVYAMEARKRADLSLGAFLRTQLGWSLAPPEAERKRIAERAQALIGLGGAHVRWLDKARRAREGGDAARIDRVDAQAPDLSDPDYAGWSDVILASIQARAPFDTIERTAEKEMVRLARTLPVWPWCEAIRGFGPVSLAIIVAEAGDLANYADKGRLWKRLGVALVDGVRQGGLAKNAPKADWIAHGYSRQRRSRLFNIGDALVKGNKRADGADGPYRACYLARKDYERARAEAAGLRVVPAARIPKGREAEFMSEGHVHRRAQRYMEKRLLRDLWQAWRRGAAIALAAE